MSYPSGHSSHSMCVGLYTFLLILRCLNEVKGIRSGVMQWVKIVVFILCMIIPVVIGGSRIVSLSFFIIYLQFDYKHSEADVNAGYVVGAICTLLAYFLVYGKTMSRYSTDGEEHSSPSKTSVQFIVCSIVISLNFTYQKGVDESNRGRVYSSPIILE